MNNIVERNMEDKDSQWVSDAKVFTIELYVVL